jgi:hypothetical protein
MSNHEKPTPSVESENAPEVQEVSSKYHEALRDQLEKVELENKTKDSEEEASEKAAELAQQAAAKRAQEESAEQSKRPAHHRGAPSKKQLRDSFNEQMTSIQDELGGGSKLFSKLIHIPVIEKTSDFIESTIARPTALLSGSIAAFLAIAIAYFIAKYYGFQLSGFETIGAFIIGWAVGFFYDSIRNKLRKKR